MPDWQHFEGRDRTLNDDAGDDGGDARLRAIQQYAQVTTISHWQRDNQERSVGLLLPNEEQIGEMSNSRRKQGSVDSQGK